MYRAFSQILTGMYCNLEHYFTDEIRDSNIPRSSQSIKHHSIKRVDLVEKVITLCLRYQSAIYSTYLPLYIDYYVSYWILIANVSKKNN